jgi:hypothetical protein
MKYRITEAERARRREHMLAITTKETCAKGGRAAGRIAAETGHLDGIRTKETCVRGGTRGGRATADSGKLSGVGLGIKTPESLVDGGRVQGAANARQGWMRHISLLRYGKPHTDCIFCKKLSPPSGNDVHAALAEQEQQHGN